MRMEEGLDTGAYCVCRTTRIEGKGAEELSDELAVLGSHALLTALVHVENGAAEWTEQDEGQVTYAPKLEKGELDLDPADPAAVLARKVQASSAAHPARCVLAGRGVTVLSGQEARKRRSCGGLTEGLAPARRGFRGSACCSAARRALTKCGTSSPTGKQAMDARAFAAGAAALREGDAIWEKETCLTRTPITDPAVPIMGAGAVRVRPWAGAAREGGPQPDRDRRPQGDRDRRPQPDRDRGPTPAARPATASGELPRTAGPRAKGNGVAGAPSRTGMAASRKATVITAASRKATARPATASGATGPGARSSLPTRRRRPRSAFDVSPARKAALQVGRFLRERDAFAQDLISKHIDASRMSREDRAFATRLVLGVVSARGTLDEIIDRSLRSPDDVQDDVRDALRIGVYEMYFLDKSPHAAVDQCVELVRTFAPKACGLANAVLRKASSLKDEFPFGNPQADLEAFARQYAFPVWLAKRLVADLGLDAASEFMEASNEPAPLFAAVNAARAADEEVRAELEAAHGDPQPVEIDGRTIPGCYRVSSGPRAAGRPHQTPCSTRASCSCPTRRRRRWRAWCCPQPCRSRSWR